MANGLRYDMHRFTVAHRKLPLGTTVCITNPKNGRSVVATVTDRGPYAGKRIVDLSKRIATELDILKVGVASVEIHVI
jgi:rare lipoprotein A